MKSMKKLTYSELKLRRDLYLNAKIFSIDDEDRAAFQAAIEGLNNEIYRRETNGSRLLAAVLVSIVLLTIVLVGCQTVKGVTGDAGWILTELSDNIQTE